MRSLCCLKTYEKTVVEDDQILLKASHGIKEEKRVQVKGFETTNRWAALNSEENNEAQNDDGICEDKSEMKQQKKKNISYLKCIGT